MTNSSIVFTTPGELPEVAITTLGVNAKEVDSNPIGFFGTGLKYAIAIILREHETITITSGNNTYTFATEDFSLREKDFSIVTMSVNGASAFRLGFTTELGKNWTLWMAYRELYSNTLDEGGRVALSTDVCPMNELVEPTTRITVTGPKFAAIHADRAQWFLSPSGLELLVATPDVEIYDAPANGLFYRGILVHEEPTLFTYNFRDGVELTEDRTVKNAWWCRWKAGNAIVMCDNEKLISSTVCAPSDTWDRDIDFDTYNAHQPQQCPTFYRTVGELYDRHNPALRDNMKMLYLRHRPAADIQPTLLSKLEQSMLKRALAFLATLGVTIPDDMNIVVTETLGKDILGEAKDNTIFLARRAFQMGTKMLAGTIFEEWVHLTHKHSDMTRSMQNYLIDKIMSLAEELRGEPI